MGKLLDELGDGYRYDVLTIQTIATNPKKLNEYDVVFLTCAAGGEEEMKDALFNYVAAAASSTPPIGVTMRSPRRFPT